MKVLNKNICIAKYYFLRVHAFRRSLLESIFFRFFQIPAKSDGFSPDTKKPLVIDYSIFILSFTLLTSSIYSIEFKNSAKILAALFDSTFTIMVSIILFISKVKDSLKRCKLQFFFQITNSQSKLTMRVKNAFFFAPVLTYFCKLLL